MNSIRFAAYSLPLQAQGIQSDTVVVRLLPCAGDIRRNTMLSIRRALCAAILPALAVMSLSALSLPASAQATLVAFLTDSLSNGDGAARSLPV